MNNKIDNDKNNNKWSNGNSGIKELFGLRYKYKYKNKNENNNKNKDKEWELELELKWV